MPNEAQVQKVGKEILNYQGNHPFSLNAWTSNLLNNMMDDEAFRVASLRFTDVAPTLRNDAEFMDHLQAYFSELEGLKGFLGKSIPGIGFLAKVISPIVRQNIKNMAQTFIAGENLKQGIKTFSKLHDQGIACSIDILGEAVISKSEAESFMASYHKAIKQIATASKGWKKTTYPEKDKIGGIARSNVSIKLSALYEHTNEISHDDSKQELCMRFAELLDTAKLHNTFINIDVEQSELLPLTLEVFENVIMQEPYQKYPHIGIVCQAYLRNSGEVLDGLIKLAKKRKTPFSIRLVKGAYWDYEQATAEQRNWPCAVFNEKVETDANYEKLLVKLIKSFPYIRPCIGSHNARSLAVAITTANESGLKTQDLEFQMLYGMAPNFRDCLKEMGYRVRQYCPVGEFIPGMSYLVRRLLENTANQNFLRMHGRKEVSLKALLQSPDLDSIPPKPTKDIGFLNHPDLDFSIKENRAKAKNALENFKQKIPVMVEPSLTSKGSDKYHHTCPWSKDQIITKISMATKDDVNIAVKSANESVESWSNLGAEKRAIILNKAADLMVKYWDELFALQVFEAGKDWHHADADISEAIDFLRFYALEATKINSNAQPISKWGEANQTVYEPRGVFAVIAPWNFPLAISAGMTSAALATGNTVVYKPAEQTSATGQLLAKIYYEAGVPESAFHFLPGDGKEVGAELVKHPDIVGIAFTGSRQVGLNIVKSAGTMQEGQGCIKKCIIEMGGKNAIIVDSDADLDEVIPAVVNSAFGFQGQKCSACSRVIVVGSAHKQFNARLKEMVEGLRLGKPVDPTYDVNALIDSEAYAKTKLYIRIGEKDGTLLAQAPETKSKGYFVPPTVFTNLKKNSKLITEEVFGPVLAVFKAKTIEEAVNMAMDSEYALTGAIFSRNPTTIEYARKHFKVGNLYINRGSTGALVSRQPFGGGALSGTSTKAGGADYLLHFLEQRIITENTMRRGYAVK